MLVALKFLGLSFSALLPVINPIGSALLLLGLVGPEKPYAYRVLARRIAISTVFFLLAIDLAGTAILAFFGICLPVVQFAGGFVLAAMGWNLLNQTDVATENGASASASPRKSLSDQIFYPFTFPVTAGPGTLVVTLTLSANATQPKILDEVFAQVGILGGIILRLHCHLSQLCLRAETHSQDFPADHPRRASCHCLYSALHWGADRVEGADRFDHLDRQSLKRVANARPPRKS